VVPAGSKDKKFLSPQIPVLLPMIVRILELHTFNKIHMKSFATSRTLELSPPPMR